MLYIKYISKFVVLFYLRAYKLEVVQKNMGNGKKSTNYLIVLFFILLIINIL